jgi:hypothetical protein
VPVGGGAGVNENAEGHAPSLFPWRGGPRRGEGTESFGCPGQDRTGPNPDRTGRPGR